MAQPFASIDTARWTCVVEQTTDTYWERDSDHRFTRWCDGATGEPRPDSGRFLRKTLSETGADLVNGSWNDHAALSNARRPFSNLLLKIQHGTMDQYLSVTGAPFVDRDGSFRGYQGTCRDVTHSYTTEHLARLEREVTRALVGADGTEAALVAAMRTVCEFQGWTAGLYWRLDEEDGVLRVHAGWSTDDDRLREMLARALGEACGPGVGLVGEVLGTNAPVWVPDISSDARALWRDFAEQTGWNSALLIPVVCRGRVTGVIEFAATRIAQPNDQLLEVVRVLGMQIGHFYTGAITLDRLRESEERYANMVELAAIGISHVDVNGRFVHVNRRLCEMLGYTREELLALTAAELSHPEDRLQTHKDLTRLSAGEIDSFQTEKRYLRKDGTPIWVHLTIAASRGVDGRRLHDISIVEDITERREAQSRIQYLATHDEMTGLANRALFNELLTRATARERRHGGRFAVLFIDLDRFKTVNDLLGHDAGDQLLKEIAARFNTNVRASDVLARFGGDEFALLVNDVADRQVAGQLARKLLLRALEPVQIADQQCRVTASIGIAMFPDDAHAADTLMKYADMAMYRAKEEGKNAFHFYSPDISAVSDQRLRIEAGLRDALARDEFSLHYQAKVDLLSREIRGVEALLRWSHPELGTVSPAQFIPIAEECGLIVPIGLWVVTAACTQAVDWLRQGLPPINVAVNLSPRQFQDQHLVDHIRRILEETGMPPAMLELEITESVMLNDIDAAVAKMNEIRDLGVRVAIDDFGTGYSSLSQLKRFPLDALKIDRSFIKGIPSDKDDMAITEAILTLGKTLGVKIVAEGVETDEQRAFLERHACNEMQGFHFSRPIPPEQFADFYRAHAEEAALAAQLNTAAVPVPARKLL
jgi:diguanylate cyclase (GGDEF)-like protein/PAS domain S-box-containing protein